MLKVTSFKIDNAVVFITGKNEEDVPFQYTSPIRAFDLVHAPIDYRDSDGDNWSNRICFRTHSGGDYLEFGTESFGPDGTTAITAQDAYEAVIAVMMQVNKPGILG